MAIYKNEEIQETIIYGSSRLGQYRRNEDVQKTALGQRIYEFSNHLGNVLVTLSDNKVPQTDGTYSSVVVSASDYYPFGLAMAERTYSNGSYRYGFNGQEQSDELDQNGNSYTAEFWQYSAVIGRRWNLDPLEQFDSYYVCFGNSPINGIDPDGAWFFKSFGSTSEQRRERREFRNQYKEFFKGDATGNISDKRQKFLHKFEGFFNEKMKVAVVNNDIQAKDELMRELHKFKRKLRRKGYTDNPKTSKEQRLYPKGESETTGLKGDTSPVTVSGGRFLDYNSGRQDGNRTVDGSYWINGNTSSDADINRARLLFNIQGTGSSQTYQLRDDIIVESSTITIDRGSSQVGTTSDGSRTGSSLLVGSTFIAISNSAGTYEIPSNAALSATDLNNNYGVARNVGSSTTFIVIGNQTVQWKVSAYEFLKFNFREKQKK